MLSKATTKALYASTVASPHVDWLTVTSARQGSGDALWDLGFRLCASGEEKGELPTAWHGHGYRGAHIDGVAYGARADGCYLRLSGGESAEHWLEAITAAEHCSRIDLAVDTHFNFPVTSLVDELYVENAHKSRHGGRPPMRRVVKDTRGGQTLYFGARTSERFGRLYDKGIESKSHGAGRRWRWELEAKEGCARTIAAGLVRAPSSSNYIQGAVASFFYDRAHVTLGEISPSFRFSEAPKAPRAAELLHWLAIGVRPTVAKLVKVYGRQRVLHALGLPLKSAVDGPESTYDDTGATICQQ